MFNDISIKILNFYQYISINLNRQYGKRDQKFSYRIVLSNVRKIMPLVYRVRQEQFVSEGISNY